MLSPKYTKQLSKVYPIKYIFPEKEHCILISEVHHTPLVMMWKYLNHTNATSFEKLLMHCNYKCIKWSRHKKRHVGVGTGSIRNLELFFCECLWGCGRLVSKRIMGNPDRPVTSLNMLLQSTHRNRGAGWGEGEKSARELIRNRAQSPSLSDPLWCDTIAEECSRAPDPRAEPPWNPQPQAHTQERELQLNEQLKTAGVIRSEYSSRGAFLQLVLKRWSLDS